MNEEKNDIKGFNSNLFLKQSMFPLKYYSEKKNYFKTTPKLAQNLMNVRKQIVQELKHHKWLNSITFTYKRRVKHHKGTEFQMHSSPPNAPKQRPIRIGTCEQ